MAEPRRKKQTFIGNPPQKRHIFVRPDIIPRSERKLGEKGRKWFAKTIEPGAPRLIRAAETVRESSLRKGKIFADPDIYFLVKLERITELDWR